MNRTIVLDVRDEYIEKSNNIAGAAGSYNAVELELSFSGLWDGTTKKLSFFDAEGLNPVYILLTTDLLKEGTTDVYVVPIPSEPLAKEGEMKLTIRGVVPNATDQDVNDRIVVAASTTFTVLHAELPDTDTAPVEPTPTQAEQLQGEIDSILATIAAAVASAEAAASSASDAATSATNAAASATAASDSASAASTSESNAATSKTDADSARDAAITAKNAAEAAQSAAETAKTASEAAQGVAETARDAAQTARTDAQSAQTAAEVARDAAQTAQGLAQTAQAAAEGAKTAAQAAQAAAETAQGDAESAAASAGTSADDAEAWAAGTRGGVPVGTEDPTYHNNSKWYKEQAESIVGSDFLLKTGDGKDVTVTFTEAETPEAPASGETLATMWGKVKKLFSSVSRASRFVIGTSTSGWTSADCDYLCDGTADDVEINAAIAALPLAGGEVVVLDGTYNITAKININKSNVCIRGNGAATVLKRMWGSGSMEGVIDFSAVSNCFVQYLQVDGNKSTYSSTTNNAGIYILNSSDCRVANCYIHDCAHSGVYIFATSTGSNNLIVFGCHILSCGNYGIYIYGNTSGYVKYANINKNIIDGASFNGIFIRKITKSDTNNNQCMNCSGDGIYLNGSTFMNVSENLCLDNGIGIRLSTSNKNLINGNICVRDDGESGDYSASQYTIYLEMSYNGYNLVSCNHCLGKAPVDGGGTGNILVNNLS